MLRVAPPNKVFRSFFKEAAAAGPMPLRLVADWYTGVPLHELAAFRGAVDAHYAAHPEDARCAWCKGDAAGWCCVRCHTGACAPCTKWQLHLGADPGDMEDRPGYLCVDCRYYEPTEADVGDEYGTFRCDFCQRAVSGGTRSARCLGRGGCVACFQCRQLGAVQDFVCARCE
jgi:hypothetical protein